MSEVIPVTGLEYCLVCTKCFLCITYSYCKGHRCCHKKDNYPMRLHTAFILPSRDAIWEQLLHALLVLFLTLLENTRQKKKLRKKGLTFTHSLKKKAHHGKDDMVAHAWGSSSYCICRHRVERDEDWYSASFHFLFLSGILAFRIVLPASRWGLSALINLI